jgi:plastocyanin
MTHPLASTTTTATKTSPIRPRRALITSALALSLASGVLAGPALVAAQDGTGAATPTPPSACQLVPVTATELTATSSTAVATPDSATPVASPAGATLATPGASPVTEETPETPVAADLLATDLEAAATAVTGCLSDGNYATLITMTSDLYRGQLFGTSSALDAATFSELAPMLPQVAYQILSVDQATAVDETTATALVTYEMAHQVRTSTWEFSQQDVDGQTVWVLTSETPAAITIPSDTSSVGVQIKDDRYTLAAATVAGPSVALDVTNGDAEDHEVLVLRFAEGTTSSVLTTSYGPTLPDGVNFIGQATVAGGSQGTLLLNGLEPGTYTIVCLLPDENGTPHLVNGMEATITVQ